MKDLTKGYPAKVIIRFAIPLMLGAILQTLYNIVDSKVVSEYVSTTALAAVGATSVVSFTITGFVNGLTQGFAILIANSFGARDMQKMRRFVAGTIVLTISAAVIMTIAALIGIVPILELLNTPEDVLPHAIAYVRIILGGIIFTAFYNMCANVLRAVGDSKTPLYFLMLSVVVNTVLDLLFVAVFHWGVEGAAYATVISQILSCVLCGTYIWKKFRNILPGKGEWKLEQGQYRNLVTTGLSMGLMSCIVNLGTVILQGAINSLGTDIVTAHTAARRVFDILTVMISTLGNAMTTYTSQNTGAGEHQRVKQGVRHAFFISMGITTFLIIICYTLGRPVLVWITSSNKTEIIEAAVMYTRISILFFYVLGPLFILRCSLQGMGRKVIPVCSSILEMIIKILSANFLVPAFGYMGVIFTEPISWIAMTILLASAYFMVWKFR